jgi:hypothetical protein
MIRHAHARGREWRCAWLGSRNGLARVGWGQGPGVGREITWANRGVHVCSNSKPYTATRSACMGRRTPPRGYGRPSSTVMVASLFFASFFSFLYFFLFQFIFCFPFYRIVKMFRLEFIVQISKKFTNWTNLNSCKF